MSAPYAYIKPTFLITDHSNDPYHLQQEEETGRQATVAGRADDDDYDPDEDVDRKTKLQELIRWLHFNARNRRNW